MNNNVTFYSYCRRSCLVSALFISFLNLAGCSREKVMELPMSTLAHDTTWSGQVLVNGDVYIPPGITLTIEPGTTIRFKRIEETSDQNMFGIDSPYYPQVELIIRGRLLARGTPKKPIVFTSAEIDPRAADWGALNFLGTEDNIVEYAKILCAYNGIHAHGSSVRVAHSEFVKNGVGVSFKAEEETPGVPWFGKRSNLVITENLFSKNKGGIGFRNSDAEITHNEIRDNTFFGIWPKENNKVSVRFNEITNNKKGVYLYQAQGVVFDHNNIYDNRDYNIAMAEAQDFPVEAANNWFGSRNREKIDELIFDNQDDSEMGVVRIDPILEKAVDWEAK
ncbi:MAG: right-handed parallel beta-helix repeat-containing protein [Proteobacteria bacterium]|nr:right-handed parallel beta-helix repeat-containing protein [Pseudomonadota bacterium]MBU1686525.1 right-handed parallel beta-helix repeat-containing protein [Pseudomonadota bacterium]